MEKKTSGKSSLFWLIVLKDTVYYGRSCHGSRSGRQLVTMSSQSGRWRDESWFKDNKLHNGFLFRQKERQNRVICCKIDVTGGYHIKWNKSDTETKLLHIFYHLWILDCTKLHKTKYVCAHTHTHVHPHHGKADGKRERENSWKGKQGDGRKGKVLR